MAKKTHRKIAIVSLMLVGMFIAMVTLPSELGGTTQGVKAEFIDNQPGYSTHLSEVRFYGTDYSLLGSVSDTNNDDVVYLEAGTVIMYIEVIMHCYPGELYRTYDYRSCVSWDISVARSSGTQHYTGAYETVGDFQLPDTTYMYMVNSPHIDLTVESGYTHAINVYFKILVAT